MTNITYIVYNQNLEQSQFDSFRIYIFTSITLQVLSGHFLM